jgi:hypothetical protein
MPPQLGLFYTYESSYVADPAIPKNFHPKAENVTFRLEGGYIHFEFDVNMPYAEMVDIAKQRVDIPAWIKVYDAQGRLQSILHKELRNLLYVEFGKKVHIEGYSALSVYPTPEESSDIERFWLTYGIMEAADTTTVDHIAVNIEFRWDPEVLHSPCIEAYESLRRG